MQTKGCFIAPKWKQRLQIKIDINDDNHFAGSSNNNKEDIEQLKKAVFESKKKVNKLDRKLKDKETVIKTRSQIESCQPFFLNK